MMKAMNAMNQANNMVNENAATQKMEWTLILIARVRQIIIKKDQIYLIEINPRLSGSIIFSIKSSFDPIKTLFKIEENVKYRIYENNIKYNKFFYRFLKSVSI